MARVFIVEDHETLRYLLVKLIDRAEGLEVCGCCDSAEAALAALENAQPELAVVDVSLPGRSGIELVRELQASRPQILCVMLSGHVSSGYVEDARAAGARAYVPKESMQHLIGTLRRVLEGGSGFPRF